MRTTALIAQNEAPQRRTLREMLSVLWPELLIVAECRDGLSAIAALEQHSPRIAFLDIRMPGASGLEVARRMSGATHVVFTTAYEEHAVRAFEAGNIEYVLKPVTAERLGETLLRLRERLLEEPPDVSTAIENLRRTLGQSHRSTHLQWITVSVGNIIKMIAVEDIQFFRSHAKHTRVVAFGEDALIRTPLKELSRALDPEQFWQIHRSVIVRVGAIKHVRRNHLGALELAVEGSSETLPVSQAYQHRFRGL